MNEKETKRSVEDSGVAPFVRKTYEMVDDVSTESMVSWSQLNNSFVVWDVTQFANLLLPKFFKHSNFSSFVRQLNTYGFRKVDSERWEFANEGFLRGQKHLLKSISRRKPVQAPAHTQPASQDPSACVELGNFGLEEDVERLKRDKNILVHQLVRFKKQQQTTDNQLQSVGQRVQVMEQRQQQMMSFLAKEMQSPVFLSQLVRRQNEGNRHITEIGKKRRLHNHGEDNLGVESDDGRIVKYQPLINEAAKSMLEQILKLNGPPKDPNAFLIDHVPDAYHVVDSVSCSDHSINRTPGSNIRFPGGADLVKESQTPQICLHDSQDDAKLSECSQALGVTLDNGVNFPDVPLSGARDSNVSLNDSHSVVKNGNDSTDADFDVLLPGSNDKFWEQFFLASPLCEVTEEVVDSSASDGDIDRECQLGQHEQWESHHHVKHLTEQMGLLTSKTERV